ncbi:hypothetical protein GMI70_08160 [Eggerthellaceae bacterium zg-893]|nr:hypothetical protein [Eggerthellaceae bacterium zg-893]
MVWPTNSEERPLTNNEEQFEKLAEKLSASSRRERQMAAAAMAELARVEPAILEPYKDQIIDALNRPEAQTRWECLDMLTALVPLDAKTCEKAVDGAETALFDEGSGPLRLSAMRFLCKLGATSPSLSSKAWPLIDEGIQCYHGDVEFSDMLNAVIDFSSGDLAPEVKEALAARMAFDAANGRGSLKKRASLILENVQPKK